MEQILFIETSTTLCSAALGRDGKIVRLKECEYDHASKLAVLIDEILTEEKTSIKNCDAVCVSMGPGSYTGLRVGVSTAKGLCYGAGKPLIAVPSLDAVAFKVADKAEECKYIIPMLDARRMEVYTAVYDNKGNRLTNIEAKIIDEGSFGKELSEGKVLFAGDAVAKVKSVIVNPNAVFVETRPSADYLLTPGLKEFRNKNFADAAYFEPLYLKEFVATVSKKKLF